jgi:hypothetical protein
LIKVRRTTGNLPTEPTGELHEGGGMADRLNECTVVPMSGWPYRLPAIAPIDPKD